MEPSVEKASLSRVDSASKSEEHGEVRPAVHFNLLATLGVTYSITAVPVAVGAFLSLVNGLGGQPIYLYCFIFVAVFQFITCISVAELASGIPHSSGPAHWIKILAPPAWASVMEYLIGWWTNCAWLCITAATNQYCADWIVATASAIYPEWEVQTWQTWLMCVGVSLIALLLNLPGGFKLLSYISRSAVVIINVTALFMIIALLVRANPKQSASVVFVEVVNTSGWESLGTVFFLSMLPGLACMGALDSALHLTDEVDNATKQVPQVMMGSFGLGALSGVITIIVLGFCNINPPALGNAPGGMALVQLFIDAYDSPALVLTTNVLFTICFAIASFSCLTSWSRLYWSFSRHEMLPFYRWTARLSSSDTLPINALILNTVLANLLTLIKIGNTTAMNAILGSVKLFISCAFIPCFALLLWRGRHPLDPNRWLNLGTFWGPILNVIAITWCLFISVWLCFPTHLPVKRESANYAAAVVVGATVIGVVYWFVVVSKKKLS